MAKAKASADDVLSTAQAAAELGISVSRMLVLINQSRLPAMRVGSYWAVRRGDLDAVRDRPPGRPRGSGAAAGGEARKKPEGQPKKKRG